MCIQWAFSTGKFRNFTVQYVLAFDWVLSAQRSFSVEYDDNSMKRALLVSKPYRLLFID